MAYYYVDSVGTVPCSIHWMYYDNIWRPIHHKDRRKLQGSVYYYFETNNVQATCLLHSENISPLLSANLSEYALDFDLLQIKHNTPDYRVCWWLTSSQGISPTPARRMHLSSAASRIRSCSESERRKALVGEFCRFRMTSFTSSVRATRLCCCTSSTVRLVCFVSRFENVDAMEGTHRQMSRTRRASPEMLDTFIAANLTASPESTSVLPPSRACTIFSN